MYYEDEIYKRALFEGIKRKLIHGENKMLQSQVIGNKYTQMASDRMRKHLSQNPAVKERILKGGWIDSMKATKGAMDTSGATTFKRRGKKYASGLMQGIKGFLKG